MLSRNAPYSLPTPYSNFRSTDAHEDAVNKELLAWGRDQLEIITASSTGRTGEGLMKVISGVL